jgi:hypothetical protein
MAKFSHETPAAKRLQPVETAEFSNAIPVRPVAHLLQFFDFFLSHTGETGGAPFAIFRFFSRKKLIFPEKISEKIFSEKKIAEKNRQKLCNRGYCLLHSRS